MGSKIGEFFTSQEAFKLLSLAWQYAIFPRKDRGRQMVIVRAY